MAQSAVWNEGRRYPQRGRGRHGEPRAAVPADVPLQEVLLAVPFNGALLGRKSWAILLVLILAHGLVIYLVKQTDSSALPATVPVPIDVVVPTPLPMEPQVSKPVPLPPVAPRQRRAQPAPVPVQRQAEIPAEVPQVHETASAEAATPKAPVSPQATSAPPPSVPAETQAAGRMGYLSNPSPIYPESALDRGLEGTVLLRVRVLAGGEAEAVEVQTSSGYRILDDAAIRTVRKWKFVPATRGGSPVDGWANVPIVFKLGK